MTRIKQLIDKLEKESVLTHSEYAELISHAGDDDRAYIAEKADAVRKRFYGNEIYVRGLIEFTNYCRNDCLYCGIRRSNKSCQRYRLSKEEILSCCSHGYLIGYRTFVLQGGEDLHFSSDDIADIVRCVKALHPDCAVTLSFGEYPEEVYKKWKDAGADRYLLRHETANKAHYEKLHPKELSLENRMRCLRDLKELGFQVGCGFMVGSPYQTSETLADDMIFLKEYQPDMVGLGPFISQKDTPFRDMPSGTLEDTLLMLSIVRLTLPQVLLPATTALGSIHPRGRQLGIQAGANVCMPNLSPENVREKYALYDNKLSTGMEAAEYLDLLSEDMADIGYKIVTARGDRYGFKQK